MIRKILFLLSFIVLLGQRNVNAVGFLSSAKNKQTLTDGYGNIPVNIRVVDSSSDLVLPVKDSAFYACKQIHRLNMPFNDVSYFGDDVIVAIGDEGTIYRSKNSGLSWESKNLGLSLNLLKIRMTDANVGYILADKGNMLKTEDGGETWNSLNIPLDLNYAEPYTNMFFVNSDVGYVFNGSYVLNTQDGGKSWNTYSTYDSAINGRLNSAWFFDENKGIMVGERNALFKTTDGGQSFQSSDPLINNTSRSWTSITFVNNNIGYIVSEKGEVMKTLDGGESWILIATLGRGARNQIFFANENEGFVISPQNDAGVYTTKDDILNYDVYFGDTAVPALYKKELQGDQLAGVNVKAATKYYWRVITRDSRGNTSQSALVSFMVK